MKCILRNMCAAPYLCCHFCPTKKCPDRCNDKVWECKYYTSDACEVCNYESTSTPPEFMIKRSGKYKREQLAIKLAKEQAEKLALKEKKRGGENAKR